MSENSAIVILDDSADTEPSTLDLQWPGQPNSDDVVHVESQNNNNSQSKSHKRKRCSLDEEFSKLRRRIDRSLEEKLENVRKNMQREIENLRQEVDREQESHRKTQAELSRYKDRLIMECKICYAQPDCWLTLLCGHMLSHIPYNEFK
ncbi:hypothetical protein N7540_005586 [Penicillium herquei]|nr:hypothetical protein N7540_005586 [Penicillium herquei]